MPRKKLKKRLNEKPRKKLKRKLKKNELQLRKPLLNRLIKKGWLPNRLLLKNLV